MRRFISGGTRGQAIVEYALGIVLVGFITISGTMLFGPGIKAHMADYETSWPNVRWAGLSLVINPTQWHPTATGGTPATPTTVPSATPTVTLTPTATTPPTATSTLEPTATSTPTATPTLTYQQWCLSMGYTWRSFLQVCTIGWTVVTPPAP